MSPSSILSRRLVGKPIDSRRLLPDVPRYEDGVADLGSSVVSAQPLLDNSPTGYDNTDYPSDSYPSGSDFYSANPTRHVWDEQNPLAANRSSMNPLDRGISVDSGTASPTSSGNITAADTPKAVTDYQEYAQHPELHGGDPKSSFWRRLGGALIDTAGTWGQGFGVPRGITHHLAQDVRYGPDAAHAKENYWQNLPLMRDAANMAENQQEIGLRQRQLDESAKYRAAMMQANADRYAQMERGKEEASALSEGGRPIPTGPTMQQSLGSFDTPAIPPSVETGPRSREEDVQNLPSRQTSLLQQPLTQNMTPEDMARRTIPAGPGGPAYQMAIPPKTANWQTVTQDMIDAAPDLGLKLGQPLDPTAFRAVTSLIGKSQVKGKPLKDTYEEILAKQGTGEYTPEDEAAAKRFQKIHIADNPSLIIKNETKAENTPISPDAGTPPPAPGQKDEAYLQKLPVADRGIIKAWSEGRSPLPSSFALKDPRIQKWYVELMNYDPSFQSQRAAVRTAFASGKESDNAKSLNTLTAHLSQLHEASIALHNNNIQAANSIFNGLANELGDSRITDFEFAKTAVADELSTALKGQATDASVQQWRNAITRSASPQQVEAAVKAPLHLMAGRMSASEQKYRNTMGEEPGNAVVYPYSRQVFSQYGIPLQGSNSTQQFPVVVMGKDGQARTFNFPSQAAADQFKKAKGIQ